MDLKRSSCSCDTPDSCTCFALGSEWASVAAYTIPMVVQPDCCCHHQHHHRPIACLRDSSQLHLFARLWGSTVPGLTSCHVLYLMLWCFPNAGVAWDSPALTWHPCTFNPEVWGIRCFMGGICISGSWESTDTFFSLRPLPPWTVWSCSDYMWSLRKRPEWPCNQFSRKL